MSQMLNTIPLGHPADYHVHLRQSTMMKFVTPAVRQGGITTAYIMPNLTPPVTTISQIKEYKSQLQALAPKTTFLMTFYLSRDLTPELVEKAAKEGLLAGIKCYPAGVTTNSSAGVDPNDFTQFYPIFEVMQKHNLILNLHGEKPSVHANHTNEENCEDIHVLNAESKFLPALAKLHNDFPQLKIVLEHCTTKAAIDAVAELNAHLKEGEIPKVVASITAHHLFLTIDDWAGAPVNFCKPVAKLPSDRRSLLAAATSGKPYYFFGSDSAPHDVTKKSVFKGVCAGVYTQPYALSYLAEAFEKVDKLDKLKDFVSTFGHNFYAMNEDKLVCKDQVQLVRRDITVPEMCTWEEEGINVVPFLAGEKLHWDVEWICN
ncbi:dihydroorotase [Martiniozyma asiatica (nom. inval.)]|nr:dihydroorotase [Martiniozyma asiatica]